jgi:hypothetical protein
MRSRRPLTRAILRKIADEVTRGWVDEALSKGWTGEVLGSGHIRLTPPPKTGGQPVVFSSTHTDYRGQRNARSYYRRWLGEQA